LCPRVGARGHIRNMEILNDCDDFAKIQDALLELNK